MNNKLLQEKYESVCEHMLPEPSKFYKEFNVESDYGVIPKWRLNTMDFNIDNILTGEIHKYSTRSDNKRILKNVPTVDGYLETLATRGIWESIVAVNLYLNVNYLNKTEWLQFFDIVKEMPALERMDYYPQYVKYFLEKFNDFLKVKDVYNKGKDEHGWDLSVL